MPVVQSAHRMLFFELDAHGILRVRGGIVAPYLHLRRGVLKLESLAVPDGNSGAGIIVNGQMAHGSGVPVRIDQRGIVQRNAVFRLDIDLRKRFRGEVRIGGYALLRCPTGDERGKQGHEKQKNAESFHTVFILSFCSEACFRGDPNMHNIPYRRMKIKAARAIRFGRCRFRAG